MPKRRHRGACVLRYSGPRNYQVVLSYRRSRCREYSGVANEHPHPSSRATGLGSWQVCAVAGWSREARCRDNGNGGAVCNSGSCAERTVMVRCMEASSAAWSACRRVCFEQRSSSSRAWLPSAQTTSSRRADKSAQTLESSKTERQTSVTRAVSMTWVV